jgi:hypothetical protein
VTCYLSLQLSDVSSRSHSRSLPSGNSPSPDLYPFFTRLPTINLIISPQSRAINNPNGRNKYRNGKQGPQHEITLAINPRPYCIKSRILLHLRRPSRSSFKVARPLSNSNGIYRAEIETTFPIGGEMFDLDEHSPNLSTRPD